MSDANQSLEELLFQAASEKLTPGERAAFLDEACRNNPALRARLETLLECYFGASGFLREQPAPVPGNKGPGDRIGRYKLREKIGEGGCGVVYVAEQEEPVRRKVALKVIKLGMDTRSVVARFEAERQALALMDHPSIARVLDAGATETGRPYFVMELVRGIKITNYCDQNHLSTVQRLGLFIQVCQAVQHAHQKGIIHRDLKPSNILVTVDEPGAQGVPKVIDFGIAKATQGKLTDQTLYTAFEQFLGTPAYMSPEQAMMTNLDIDTRSDIYSLGVLLYELLTGKTPFEPQELLAAGFDEMRRTICVKEPARPSTRLSTLLAGELASTAKAHQAEAPKLIHQVKGDLDWIVMKCLEKDRKRRYETANGLAADLQRHLENEPVAARKPTMAYRLQKAWRRHSVAFAATAVVTAALVLGIGVSIWQAIAASRARDAEREQRVAAQVAQQAEKQARQRADHLLYDSDMNLAQQAIKANNLGWARELLDRHRPKLGETDQRGWEWRYLWQLTRSSALVTLTNRPVRGSSVSMSPDGKRLAVGWYDGRVDLWDVPGRRLVRALTDHEDVSPGHVAFSPVRDLLAATSGSNTVTLYDLDSGHESIIWREPDERQWDDIDRKNSPDAFKRYPNLAIGTNGIGVHDLSFSQDGSKLVLYATSADTQNPRDAVWVVDVSSNRVECCHPTDAANSEFHGAARLSPDNQRLYLSRYDYWTTPNSYSIQCLDLTTGREIWQTEHLADDGLTALAVSPDGRTLASDSGFADPSIRVWDATTGRLVKELEGHTSWISKLVFTQDGNQLVSAAADQTIRFWDTATWKVARVLRGHQDEIHAVAISETAHLVASVSKDGELMLWNEEGQAASDGYLRLAG
ncbi:MAG: serine/threonine-protein kinase, partial [Verrucomicrobiota bacterium]